jgi:Domain of unknown function (DUF4271)
VKQIFFFGLFIFFVSVTLCAQSTDSIIVQNDSLQIQPVADSVKHSVTERPVFKLKNKLLNSDAEPVSFAVQFKKTEGKDTVFYLIAGMILLLAFLKYFFNRYFTNLFRVFFNTSLRQSQLTDQLLQAKLPSLLFNLFFTISGGLYAYILLSHFQLILSDKNWVLIFSSMALLGLIYLIKFSTLKFTGWVTGLTEVTNTYVFVIFLINKIIGIFLVPFIVILSFSDIAIVKIAILISLMSIGIFLLLRFFRSYGLLQNQLKISKFHFILYIMGIELLPLLLIYKGLMVYLSKNL